MNDEKQIFFEGEYEALPESGHGSQWAAVENPGWRLYRPQDEWAPEPDFPQDLPPDEAVEVLEVDGHVRQLGHSRENTGR